MGILILKLTLTPALIAAASLASRRWGAEVGGWLVGIPFTSGPIAFFLAIGPGVNFAADAAVGIMAGAMSQAAFALAYSWTALRFGWAACVVAATAAFAIATVVLDVFRTGAQITLAMAVLGLLVALVVLPRQQKTMAAAANAMPWWDIPARMVVATVFVVALTSAAPLLGARLSGLLSPFPVYGAVLCVFAHRLQGKAAAIGVMRGLLLGLFSFAAFFAALALLLVPDGIVLAFVVAIAAALVLQAASLFVGRRLELA